MLQFTYQWGEISKFSYANKLYVLTNAMHQGSYSRLDLGLKYDMDKFIFGLLAATTNKN